MAELHTFALAAADNNDTPPDGFPEDMNYSAVNNSAREVMAALRRAYSDMNGSLVTAGTGAAYSVTPNATYASLFDGLTLTFRVHTDSTASPPTLSVGGLAPTSIMGADLNDIPIGGLQADQRVRVVYDATNTIFIVVGGTSNTFQNVNITNDGPIDLVSVDAPLVIGADPTTTQHLEFDNNTVQGKVGTSAQGDLLLNPLGGEVILGGVGSNIAIPNNVSANLSNNNVSFRIGSTGSSYLAADAQNIQVKFGAGSTGTLGIQPLGGALNLAQNGGSGVVTSFGDRTRVQAAQLSALEVRNGQDGNPTLGTAQSNTIDLQRADGTDIARFGFAGTTSMLIQSNNNGAPVLIRGANASATQTSIFQGDPDGQAQLFHAGTAAVQTVDETANTNVTSAQVVHRNGATYPVGLANWPLRAGTASGGTITLDESDVGTMLLQLSNNGTITFPSDANIRVGSFGLILNNSTTNLTLNPSGTNVLHLDGGGSSPSNASTLAIAGWCWWWKRSDTVMYVGGSGIS